MEGLTPVARNIDTVRRYYAAGAAADDSGRRDLVSPDIVWHVPGDNPVAGEYRGADAVLVIIGERMAPLTVWDIEVVDVMGNADHVVATVRVRGERRGIKVDMPGAHAFRLDDDGRIVEGWGFLADQGGLDEFFRA